MTDDLAPIVVAGDDGVILADGDDRGTRCEHCGERFDRTGTAATFDGSTWRYQCPCCGRWTEGHPPG